MGPNTEVVTAFLAVRVYAIYRDWRPFAPMAAFGLGRVIISVVRIFLLLPIRMRNLTRATTQYLQTHYTPVAVGPPLFGCGADFNKITDQTYKECVLCFPKFERIGLTYSSVVRAPLCP